ncbi:uncharacterized protein LOC110033681, partial [Phalaenopsis equestris]|uniref:uncharacterized protein LOC110033681 n=1 Tax=Phalaenopsis equestris TaxID=78828 RepID=UPI0009E34FF1
MEVFASFVYAGISKVARIVLWESLQLIQGSIDKAWLVGGGFNCVSSPAERKGGRPPNPTTISFFNDNIQKIGLFDLRFSGPSFTWRRKDKWERLDRVLANDNWIQKFLQTSITHLSIVGSDHRPLLITIENKWKEQFLQQKAAKTKFTEGDRNTKFDHACIKYQRKCNTIHSIKDQNGIWIKQEEEIAKSVVQYCQNLMNEINCERVHIDSNLFVNSKKFTANLHLKDIPDEEVINLYSSKSTGPNGFTADFYKKAWEVIKVETSIKDSWNHYRTLSLNNVISKTISKIIVHRPQPVLPQLVSNNQAAFVKSRSIGDNILLAQKLLQDLEKTCRGGNAIFKLDLKKAYDMENRKSFNTYHNRAKMDISHLIYVDDILVFTRATKSATKSIMECLQHFQQMSGLKVNNDKFEILISKRASLPTKQWIYSYTGFSNLNLPFKYLGIHLMRGRTKLIQFDEVIDKIISTLQGWSNSYLSNGGRITLLKSIPTYIPPLYVLQVATMKRSTSLMLERIFNRFLWAGNRKQVAWAGWQKVAKPWEAGDLGFKGLHQMQHISLGKLWIKFRQNESLSTKFMQAKCCKFDHPGEVTRKVEDSKIWCPTNYLEPLEDDKEGDLLVKDCWNSNVWSEDILQSILKDQPVSSISAIQFDRNNKDHLNLKNKTKASISKDIQNKLYSWNTCQWNFSSCQKHLTPFILFFSWRALNNLLPTDDILKLKGLKGPSRCHLYCIKDWQEINLMPIPFIVAWFIWMSRNMAKHEEREASTTRAMINCLSYLNKLISWRKIPKILQTIPSMVANNIKIIK